MIHIKFNLRQNKIVMEKLRNKKRWKIQRKEQQSSRTPPTSNYYKYKWTKLSNDNAKVGNRDKNI